MRCEHLVRPSGLVILLAALPVAATAQTAGQHRCASALQDKVAWNYAGDKHWSAAHLARLCKGAEDSVEPARCFRKVMHGGVNWGGGTRWELRNAIALCRRARNADARISCFRKKVAGQTGWRGAIRQCARAAPALRAPRSLKGPLKPGTETLRKPEAEDRDFKLDRESGDVRFGDGEHGRRPPTDKDGADIRKGAGSSGNLEDQPLKAPDSVRKGADALTGPGGKKRLRLKPRVTGYRPSTALQGGEVTVQGHMLGNRKGDRRLVLGLNANPDHGLARDLTARSWNDREIRTRVPENVLPAKYFIALVGPDGKWLTNRLRTLRVLGRQRVSVRAVIEFKCYAEVTQYPRQVQAALGPVRPDDLGMKPEEKISVPILYKSVKPGKLGSRLYVYSATADLPQGLFEARIKPQEGAAYFKAKDWSRTEDEAVYEFSKPCLDRRRVNPETGMPLKKPPVYVFKFVDHPQKVRIGPRTKTLELADGALADPAELGALPEPTPVDE